MHIVIFGASGLIGRHLRAHFLAQGHTLTSVSRFGNFPKIADLETTTTWRQIETCGLPPCDTLIALMGEPIARSRWTARVKQTLRSSRCGALKKLHRYLREAPQPPKRAIVASAVGIYPTSLSSTFDETTPLASRNGVGETNFLRDLCIKWEQAARALEEFCAVTRLRLGAVLAADGGLLPQLFPLFRRGFGAQMGDGTQPFPWIHIDDVCQIVDYAIAQTLNGPLNCVAPERVDQKMFAECFARCARARLHLRLPAFVLRWALGERSDLLLKGSNVISTRLSPDRCPMAFPTLHAALTDCCTRLFTP